MDSDLEKRVVKALKIAVEGFEELHQHDTCDHCTVSYYDGGDDCEALEFVRGVLEEVYGDQ